MINCDYLQNKRYFATKLNSNYLSERKLGYTVIKNGVILPYKGFSESGRIRMGGGVVDGEGNFIVNSGLHRGSGCGYSVGDDVEFRKESVIYLGLFISVWGHCLTDNIRRLWFLKDVEILSWEKIIEEYTKGIFTKVHFSKTDVCIMLFSLEYIKDFSQFLTDVCRSAEKQVIIICRPFDKDEYVYDRWLKRRFVLEFTEDFLVKEMRARKFVVNSVKKLGLEAFAYAYDFRRC